MNHRPLAVLVVIVIGTPMLGCGGSTPPAKTDPEPPGRCVVDPEIAATRQPEPPGEISCENWEGLSASCSGGDASACYQFAVCVKTQEVTMASTLTPEQQAQHVEAAMAGLRVACDGGIPKACSLRIGMQMQDGQPLPADGCADLVHSCNLGDDEGCAGCRYHDCD